MSKTHDDYGHTHENPKDASPEPADPGSPKQITRQELRLAPSSVKVDRLPNPLRDGKRVLTVNEARGAYLRTQRASWNSDGRTSKYERHRYELYPRILEADRHFQTEFAGLTTAMLTRRLSPLDDTGSWLTPWECNEMLHGGSINRSVREALNYQLEELPCEWVAVTAPTRSAGTPHEHIYLWIDDPDNAVRTGHLEPGLDKHLKHCVNAYQNHHQYRTDGTEGAITVAQSPQIVQQPPDRIHEIIENTAGSMHPNTRGAQYLASQLAHLPLGDFYDGAKENPPQALLEGAALSWASPRNWFRSSKGVPAL